MVAGYLRNPIRKQGSLWVPDSGVIPPPYVDDKSFRFDGVNERLSIANDVALQVGPAFFGSMWIKVTGAIGNFATAFAKSNGTANGWTIQLRNQTEWRFWINFGNNTLGNGSNGGWYYAVLPETWTDGQWHHVVGGWDGAVPLLWVDNVAGSNPVAPSGEGSLPSFSVDTVNPMMIAAESDGGNHTAATIDEVQFYNVAPTNGIVSSIYNGGCPKDERSRTGAVCQYRMGDDPLDDATGTTGNIEDVIAGLHNGTPLNTEASDIVNDAPCPTYSNTKSFLFGGVNELLQGPGSSLVVGAIPAAITYSSWIKTTNTGNQYIQSVKRDITSASSLFSMRTIGANKIGLVMRIGSPPGGEPGSFVQPEPVVPGGLTDGLWHHVCGTWDGTGWAIYVDGVLVASGLDALTVHADPVFPYTVGGFTSANPLSFNGNIEEPGVFTGATKFTLLEAQELYNGGVPADLNLHSRAADLKSWYRNGDDPLDDATGTTGRIVDQIDSPTLDATPLNTESGDIVLDVP